MIDHHVLLQVLLNLARNSERALSKSNVRSVWVSVSEKGHRLSISFEDSGPGVPQPETLFQPFQSGNASSGLGLYVSRKMVQSAGGDLRYVQSPHGARFVVELPCEAVAQAVA